MGRSKGGGKKGGGGMKGFIRQTQTAKKTENDSSSNYASDVFDTDDTKRETTPPIIHETGHVPEAAIETKGELRERHKNEMAAAKRTANNMGKKNKLEAAAYIEILKERHGVELKALRESTGDVEGEHTHNKEEPVSTEKTLTAATSGKKSKSRRRREKSEQRMEEQEARIEADIAKLGMTEKTAEEEILKERLATIDCTIHEIRPDGHCLYNAIRDQLLHVTDVPVEVTCAQLRLIAANELRQNVFLYFPFFATEEKDGPDIASYQAHCNRVESTAEWGGELEIQALSQSLERRIIIYSVDLGKKVIGEQFPGLHPLRLCFMRHAYQLGAHYNSIRHGSDPFRSIP